MGLWRTARFLRFPNGHTTRLLGSPHRTVTFTAPGSQMLLPGDSFYINIYFSGYEGRSVMFRGGSRGNTGSAYPLPNGIGLADGRDPQRLEVPELRQERLPPEPRYVIG